MDPRTPVLVGVGQFSNRTDEGAEPLEPADMMVEALRRAETDSGASVLSRADSVRVVALWSWRYRDPAAAVAQRLGLDGDVDTAMTTMGGNAPQMLVNETARDIVAGRTDIAVLTGAESWRTRMSERAEGRKPDWTVQGEDVAPPRMIGRELDMNHPAEAGIGLRMPVQMYPMFENALRHHLGRDMADHRDRIAELWAGFAAVAADNPHAWIRGGPSAVEIREPGPHNRMIGFPYTKMMCSNNAVEQGAALIMCSAERAESLGVDRDRWVFPVSGTDAHDHAYVSERRDLHTAPAVGIAGRRAIELAGAGVDDVAHIDLYSCFPVAPEIGVREIGLDAGRPLTVTGGLSFAGGPWNNYPMHAIAAMVEAVRSDAGSLGLVWANGGYLTKHSFGVYSTAEPASSFRYESPQAEADAIETRELDADHVGPVTLESWTVMHNRQNRPETAFAAGLTADGRRTWCVESDAGLMETLLDGAERIGHPAERTTEGGLAL